jgi:hypothetical protein
MSLAYLLKHCNNGRLYDLPKYYPKMKGGMIGGVIISRDDNNNITEIRPYNDKEKKDIIIEKTYEEDMDKYNEHKDLLKEINITNFTEEEKKKFKEDIKKDKEFLKEIIDTGVKLDYDLYRVREKIDDVKEVAAKKPKKTVERVYVKVNNIDDLKVSKDGWLLDNNDNYLTGLKNGKYRRLTKDDVEVKNNKVYSREGVGEEEIRKPLKNRVSSESLKDSLENYKETNMSIEKKIALLNKRINSLQEIVNEDRDLLVDYPSEAAVLNPRISSGEDQLKTLRNELKQLQGLDSELNKPVVIQLSTRAREKEKPERYKYTRQELIDKVDKLYEDLEEDIIENPQYGITDAKFKEIVVPKGGPEKFEEAVELTDEIKKAIFDSLGINEKPKMENFQKIVGGTDPTLPIDLVDYENKLWFELKKYVKYDYNQLVNDLSNIQVRYLQNDMLKNISSILKKKVLTSKDHVKIMNMVKGISDDNNDELDKEKIIELIKSNFGGPSIPIGVKKFGNIGEFKTNKLNGENEKKYVEDSLNEKWDVEIDYNKMKGDKKNKTYGKVITVQKKGGITNYSKTPKDYVFVIATKNELLTFNYSDYIRKNEITSPLNVFKVGEDFYDTSSDKASYWIPIDLFKKVEKTTFIKPKIDKDIFDYLDYDKDKLNNLPPVVKKKVKDIKKSDEYLDYLNIPQLQQELKVKEEEIKEHLKGNKIKFDENNFLMKTSEFKQKSDDQDLYRKMKKEWDKTFDEIIMSRKQIIEKANK